MYEGSRVYCDYIGNTEDDEMLCDRLNTFLEQPLVIKPITDIALFSVPEEQCIPALLKRLYKQMDAYKEKLIIFRDLNHILETDGERQLTKEEIKTLMKYVDSDRMIDFMMTDNSFMRHSKINDWYRIELNYNGEKYIYIIYCVNFKNKI